MGSVVAAHALSSSEACGIFDQDQGSNCVPCIGRWIVNHCATREVPPWSIDAQLNVRRKGGEGEGGIWVAWSSDSWIRELEGWCPFPDGTLEGRAVGGEEVMSSLLDMMTLGWLCTSPLRDGGQVVVGHIWDVTISWMVPLNSHPSLFIFTLPILPVTKACQFYFLNM